MRSPQLLTIGSLTLAAAGLLACGSEGDPSSNPGGGNGSAAGSSSSGSSTGGGGPNGTAKLYLNGAAPVVAANQVLLDQIDDVNNWIGRSQWPDPLYDDEGNLLESDRVVAGLRLPRGLDTIVDDDRVHIYETRVPITKVHRYFGPRLITGEVDQLGSGAVFRAAVPRVPWSCEICGS